MNFVLPTNKNFLLVLHFKIIPDFNSPNLKKRKKPSNEGPCICPINEGSKWHVTSAKLFAMHEVVGASVPSVTQRARFLGNGAVSLLVSFHLAANDSVVPGSLAEPDVVFFAHSCSLFVYHCLLACSLPFVVASRKSSEQELGLSSPLMTLSVVHQSVYGVLIMSLSKMTDASGQAQLDHALCSNEASMQGHDVVSARS